MRTLVFDNYQTYTVPYSETKIEGRNVMNQTNPKMRSRSSLEMFKDVCRQKASLEEHACVNEPRPNQCTHIQDVAGQLLLL